MMLLSAYVCAVHAQPASSPVPAPEAVPDLRALKAGLRRTLITATLPEMKQYREELAALEQKQATAQEFANAIKTRDTRLKVEQQISTLVQEANMLATRPSVDNAARLAARIELKLSDAKLTGAQLDSMDGALSGWGTAGASATWQLPGLPAGGYEVVLRYSGGDGEVVLQETFYSLKSPCKGDAAKPVEQNLGTLRIKEGTGTLTLTALPPEKSASLKVYSLVLIPSAI